MTSKALSTLMLQKAAEPNGFSNAEIELLVAGRWAKKTVGLETAMLLKAGFVFKAQYGHNCRYFDTKDRADAYKASVVKPKRPPRVKKEPKSSKALLAKPKGTPIVVRPPAGGPARMPGEPHFPENADGSPAYKRTIAPPPPVTLYRSNTWSTL